MMNYPVIQTSLRKNHKYDMQLSNTSSRMFRGVSQSSDFSQSNKKPKKTQSVNTSSDGIKNATNTDLNQDLIHV